MNTYLKKPVTEEARDAARIALSVRDVKWSAASEPICDFCAGPHPVVVYAASRASTGAFESVWRWMACETCEQLIDVNNWAAIHDRIVPQLRRRLGSNISDEVLSLSVDKALGEFHLYAINKKEKS